MQELLQQLDAAVAEVFLVMLSRSCAPSAGCGTGKSGLTASVAFSGSLEGHCAVHLCLRSADELTAELTGEAPEPGSALPADTLGELCNMIAGSWKSRLEPHLSTCLLSSPTVIAGLLDQPGERTVTRSYVFSDHCLTLKLELV